MNYNKYIAPLLISLTFIYCSSVHAAGIINMGLASGGDTLAQRSDGVTLKAGGGLSLELGLEVSEPNDPLVFEFLIGTKFDSVTAGTTTAKTNSTPLHALIMLRNEKLLIGGGIAYYMNPSYEDPFGGKTNFNNSMGYVLEGDYGFARGIFFGLRYTSIKFKGGLLVDSSGRIFDETDASNFALMLGFKF